jgi:hypothetical protein
MHSARVDLTSKALGRCRPVEMVRSLASTLLVLYLALSFVVVEPLSLLVSARADSQQTDFDECQVLLLCAQMLRVSCNPLLYVQASNICVLQDRRKAWFICCLRRDRPH